MPQPTAAIPGAFEPDLTKWDAWRPDEVAVLLAGVEAPWCVAAGWAIDLFVGGARREHEDMEIAVPRAGFGEITAALAAFEFFVPARVDGRDLVWPLDNAGATLETYHQTWVREPATGLWRLDVFRDDHDGDTWICRRDESIRLPYSAIIERTADGIPYLRPDIVLLFKAKHFERPKDQADLETTLPHLQPLQRRWLAESLARVHPGHPWLEALR